MNTVHSTSARILTALLLLLITSYSYSQIYYLDVKLKNETKRHLITSIDSIIYESYNAQPYYMKIKNKNGYIYEYSVANVDSVSFIEDFVELYLDNSFVINISFCTATVYGALKLDMEVYDQSEFGLLVSESLTDLKTKGLNFSPNWVYWDLSYNFEVSGLTPKTTYYYCTYILYNGKYAYSDVNTFTTTSASEVIQTGPFDCYSSSVSSTVYNYNLLKYIDSCGICYGLNPEPTLEEDISVSTRINEYISQFNIKLENIPYDTLINYRAFVKIGGQVYYGATIQFYGNTINTGTINITDFSIVSKLGINDGYEELGICYGTNEAPLITDKKETTNALNDSNEFYITLSDIPFDTIVYYRAFVNTGEEIRYGKTMSFGGNNVNTGIIDTTSFQIKSSVKYNGGFTEYGVCYSNSDNPTIDDMTVFVNETDQDNNYVVTLTDIPFGTVFYRAYVIKGGQVYYGDIRKFEGNQIYTGEFNEENFSISTSVKYAGNYPNAEIGVCYKFDPGISKDYIIYSNHVTTTLDNSNSVYDIMLDYIPFDTVYYCSYVNTNGRIIYGEVKSFEGNRLTTGVYDQQSLEIKSHLKYKLFGYDNVTYGIYYYFKGDDSFYDRKRVETMELDSLNNFSVMLSKIPYGTTVNYHAFVEVSGRLYGYGDELSFVKEMRIGEPIDLGLSALWSSINVGADFPEEAGFYYAWGETEPKSLYTWYKYKWADTTSYYGSYKKYNYLYQYHSNIDIDLSLYDMKYRLDDEDDVAKVKWGGEWSTPTDAQMQELVANCTRQTVYINGMKCFKMISKIPGYTDNFIILPAAGFYYSSENYQNSDYFEDYNVEGYYWSNTYGNEMESRWSYVFDIGAYPFYWGLNIRPVCVSNDWMEKNSLKFSVDSISLLVGSSIDLSPSLSLNDDGVNNIYQNILEWTAILYSDNTFVVPSNTESWVEARSAGIAHLSMECGSSIAKCTVEVTDDINSWLEQTNIKFNKDTVISVVGNNTQSQVSFYRNNIEVYLTSLTYNVEMPNGGQMSVPYHSISWNIDNPLIATVDDYGEVFAKKAGTANIIVSLDSIPIATQTIIVLDESSVVPEYIDLGLSVNWATFNIDALDPTDYGGYYAWGETEQKEEYSWDNYQFRAEGNSYDNVKFSKYISDSRYGQVDNKTTLELINDVAHVKWGENWRIPSIEEFHELINNCYIVDTIIKGISGKLISSKIKGYKGRSVFFPAAGYKEKIHYVTPPSYAYWTNALDSNYSNSALACYEFPYYEIKKYNDFYTGSSNYLRYCGLSVRPVTPSELWLDSITLELNYTDKTMMKNGNIQLSVSVKKNGENVYYPVKWESNNESVASVNESGLITANSAGTAVITVKALSLTNQCIITVLEDTIIQHEYVDLGLSKKWAVYNVDALSIEDYGGFYAWGETETKTYYSWDNYKYGDSYSSFSITKYSYRIDYIKTLEESDDVATVKWGKGWQMPTRADFRELLNYCSWEHKIINGVSGFIFTSRIDGYTDRSIFLPYGNNNNYYWSNELYNENYPGDACVLSLYYNSYSSNLSISYSYRSYGFLIRPVFCGE